MRDLGYIKDLAVKLNLVNLAKSIPDIEATDKEWDFLERMLRNEQAVRDTKKEGMLIKQARFPFVKTMDEFNLDGQENLISWHFEKLSEPNWIDEKYNVLIIGGAGTGKTHLSVAIGLKVIRNSKRVFYTTVNELLYLLKTKDTVMKSKTRLNFIDECSLLILDELGYTPLNRDDMLTLYEKVDSYNKRKSIVVITNRDFEGWADIFHDEVIATTLLDRRIENCQVIHLTGGSYRLRSHQGIFDTK